MTVLPSRQDTKINMNRLPSVSSLMSPPEAKPFDSFSSSRSPFAMSQDSCFHQEVKLPPISDDRKRKSELDLPSPPVTPYAGNKKRKSDSSEQIDGDLVGTSSRDPVLFPRDESVADVGNDEPLFDPVLVHQHILLHMAQFGNRLNKPTVKEYELAVSCVPNVSTQYNRDPAAWARKERQILEDQLALMNRYRPEESRQSKLKTLAPAPPKKIGLSQPGMPRTRAKRTPNPTPTKRLLDNFDTGSSSLARSSRLIGTNRDDTDYKSLKDYSPPVESLAGNTKGLKADWKGQMLDLSNDPDRQLLDPAEVNLAATLRLSCATYLCSKRRIFEARVKALSIGKEFRKTDAQQACKIDVNKASKLWTAYDRVGWFKPEHFIKFLQ